MDHPFSQKGALSHQRVQRGFPPSCVEIRCWTVSVPKQPLLSLSFSFSFPLFLCAAFFLRAPSRPQKCLSSVFRLTPASAVSVSMCVQPWVHVCCCEVEHVCVGPQRVWVNCSSLLAGTQWHGSLSPPLICFPTEREREGERAGGERVVPVLLPALHAWCFSTPDLSGIEPLSNTCTHRERENRPIHTTIPSK